MIQKKAYEYKLQLQSVASEEPKQLEIHFTNHDDIFKIVEMTERKGIFATVSEATEFAIGLKLFSEVMLRNKDAELFKELQPAMRNFMSALKQSSPNNTH